ncbi:MAG: hypothetical protein RMJ43_04850 [Chloroherpetonaceae bacterium]|nr:hypothetical protein [Chthonomonadaceae bacterium]MDW8207143.1 hypothetical protein [Chloroherpetonaceae bacterium]
MHILKKQIQKEDGRYLIFYHAPASATEAQRKAFREIDAPEQPVTLLDDRNCLPAEESHRV